MCVICYYLLYCFFFNDTATTEIYTYLHTLSLHDALPTYRLCPASAALRARADPHRLHPGADGRGESPSCHADLPRRFFRDHTAPHQRHHAGGHRPDPGLDGLERTTQQARGQRRTGRLGRRLMAARPLRIGAGAGFADDRIETAAERAASGAVAQDVLPSL